MWGGRGSVEGGPGVFGGGGGGICGPGIICDGEVRPGSHWEEIFGGPHHAAAPRGAVLNAITFPAKLVSFTAPPSTALPTTPN